MHLFDLYFIIFTWINFQDVVVKKKKKLTPKERAEQIRLEEERISKIEKELADSSETPENAEQFDRLLLANPNSSELWAKYMSFHLAVSIIYLKPSYVILLLFSSTKLYL